MGSLHSKTKKKEPIKFTDYSKVKVPKGHELLKIATYNVSLRNGVNIEMRIDDITNYIFSCSKNKEIDIICLQGVHDYGLATILIRKIKERLAESNKTFYFIPEFDEIQESKDNSHHIPTHDHSNVSNLKPTSKKHKSNNETKNTKVQNIIISKYPIVSTLYGEIDDKNDFGDIIGIHTLVCANISISGNMISIYNIALS